MIGIKLPDNWLLGFRALWVKRMVDDIKIKIPTIKSAALFDGAQANTLLEGILRKICDKNK